jgi:homoserine dehydrogenase
MPMYNLCLLGFGNVGRNLVQILLDKSAELRDKYDITWRITGVATRRMGWIAHAEGLDPRRLLAGDYQADGTLKDVRGWLSSAQADVLFEMSSLNPQDGQPAIEHLRAALEQGAHALTANKGAIVHAYHELKALAQEKK